MKKIIYTIAIVLGFQASVSAQSQQVTVHVPNSVKPLVEKWADEYSKTNAGVEFVFKAGKAQAGEKNSLSVVSNSADGVNFARYAVLPVSAKESEAAGLIGRRLNAKRIKALFFVEDLFEDDEPTATEQKIHIYTATGQQSVSRFYAEHFDEAAADYRGKKISGDDSYLTVAVSRDPWGVTINTLSNIFDLESRQLKKDIALLPLDLDKQGEQVLADGQLDDILTLLEHARYSEIPVGNAAFAYDHSNALLNDFVQWTLTNGAQYLHQYGLLKLPSKDLAQE
ncbi:MAG: hypothetical protein IJ911_00490 [Salinivirgaceae bacterium]|nr:hypothetical protein [Salinivirgaceae bacterium]